jgi:hypothetical protein
MKPILRCLAKLGLPLVLVAASWAAVVAQTNPLLAIPDGVPGASGQPVTLPVTYSANGNLCSSLIFAIDFDETKLSFDPTDADEDGIPDAISLNIPAAFFTSVTYDGADTDSEIDIMITDPSIPLAGMPSRTLLNATFMVNPGFTGLARVGFSTDPPASCGTTTGQGVTVTTDDGSVTDSALAIHLSDFRAEAQADGVLVAWETASELGNQGFNLYRSATPGSVGDLMTFVPSQAPGSSQGASYVWQDTDIVAGHTYWYWLEDVDLGGATTLHGPVSATVYDPTAVTMESLSVGHQPAGRFPRWLQALVARFK